MVVLKRLSELTTEMSAASDSVQMVRLFNKNHEDFYKKFKESNPLISPRVSELLIREIINDIKDNNFPSLKNTMELIVSKMYQQLKKKDQQELKHDMDSIAVSTEPDLKSLPKVNRNEIWTKIDVPVFVHPYKEKTKSLFNWSEIHQGDGLGDRNFVVRSGRKYFIRDLYFEFMRSTGLFTPEFKFIKKNKEVYFIYDYGTSLKDAREVLQTKEWIDVEELKDLAKKWMEFAKQVSKKPAPGIDPSLLNGM